MFERFDEAARQAVVHAQDGARGLGQPFIGTEHLLLGLVWDGAQSTAATALRARGVTPDVIRTRILSWRDAAPLGETDAQALHTIGIDLDAVRAVVEGVFGPGALDEPPADAQGARGLRTLLRRRAQPVKGHLPLTRNAKKALENAIREARRLESGRIEAGHLLLGLLQLQGTPDTRILADAGVDPLTLRDEIESALAQTPESPSPSEES